MRKFFVILLFFAFTFDVKAEGTGGYTSEIVIAEGEDISLAPVLVAQNTLRNDGWYENCASGTEIRVYIDYLPNDDSITLNTKVLDVRDSNSTPWTYKTSAEPETHSSLEWFYLCQQSAWDTAIIGGTDNYDKFIQYETFQDTLSGNEYVAEDELSRVNALEVSNTYFANDSESVQGGRARAYNRALINNAVMLPNAGVMINNLHITITNSVGQVVGGSDTNLFITLTNLVDIVQGIQDELGFTNSGDTLKSLLDRFMTVQLTGWNAIWTQLQDIRDYTSNLTNLVDYTPYLVLLDSFNGTNGVVDANNLLDDIRRITFGNPLSSIVGKGSTRRLLYGDWYDFVNGKINSITSNVGWQGTESFLSDLDKWQVIRYYFDTAMQLRQATFETNIVDGVSLGRDWLNLATNDISSLPYWLNQQDFSSAPPIGVTNWQAQTRWTVLTNQYAQIGLTGSGQQANSTETWNYFKRLEMLLAALVYKQTDYEGKIDPHESGNNASVSSSVATGEDQINTSLSSVKDALTLSTIGNAKNNIVSLFQTATSAFDVNGSKRVINVMETDVATGNESAGVTVNVDFTQGELGDFADFVHHLFGFAWGFGSLFIFWRVCKFCWDMGYKVVKFHYSLCRKFLGI